MSAMVQAVQQSLGLQSVCRRLGFGAEAGVHQRRLAGGQSFCQSVGNRRLQVCRESRRSEVRSVGMGLAKLS
jgi:hypothetical protein